MGNRIGAAVGVDILTEQSDFHHSGFNQGLNLIYYIGRLPRYLPASGVRNHAIGAKIITALHNGHKARELKLLRIGDLRGRSRVSGDLWDVFWNFV